jgi:hypothetical protein
LDLDHEKGAAIEKEKCQSRVGRRMGVLYIAMYGQTVTSFGKTVPL